MSYIKTAMGAASGSFAPLPAFPHDWANGQRIAVGAANTYSAQITSSNTVNVRATVPCFITVSPTNSGGEARAASAGSGTSWPLDINETYTVVLPDKTSYIGVIRDTTDGFLYIHPALA